MYGPNSEMYYKTKSYLLDEAMRYKTQAKKRAFWGLRFRNRALRFRKYQFVTQPLFFVFRMNHHAIQEKCHEQTNFYHRSNPGDYFA